MDKIKKTKIVLTGGGTGGHIMPLVAVARELKKLYPAEELELHYIGPKDKSAFDVLWAENIKTHSIPRGKIRRYFSFSNIIDVIYGIPAGYIKSFCLLLFVISSKLVFSKGGSGSTVVCYAAKHLGVPVFIHESDVVPGLSNKKTSKFAKKIFTSFPITEYFDTKKAITVGNPIRKEILDGDINKAIEMFGLASDNPVVLFVGGSQGAVALNEFIMLALNSILKNYEVIHVAGPKNYGKLQIQSKYVTEKNLLQYYHLYKFLNEAELKNAYKAASVIVSRAGSGSIFEIAATGKPSILIPLPTAAGDHQSKNAYQYARTGAAIVLEQENLTDNLFLGELRVLIAKSQDIQNAALLFAKPEAAQIIASQIAEYVRLNYAS